MHIVHPLEAMKKEAESNYVYFKTEHHWTDDGAFVAYKELMKEIRKKHKDIPILKQEDFTISYNNLVKAGWFQEYNWGTSTLNMPKPFVRKLHNINYRYYKYKDYNLLQKKTVDIPNHLSKYFYYPKGVDYRVILLGSSVNENLCQFIPFTFKNVFRLRNITVRNHPVKEEFKIMKYHEKEMLDYKPDIIIFGISYWNMLCLNDIFVMN